MLTDEVPQVQEVRYCLKTLREQMAARQNSVKIPSNGFKVSVVVSNGHGTNGSVNESHSKHQVQEDENSSMTLREVTKHLCSRLQEMERRHQEEKERLQTEYSECQQRCVEEKHQRVQEAEMKAEEQRRKVDEMQKLMAGLELENVTLREKIAAGETNPEKQRDTENRCARLEKELETLKNKNHNLDDMLKSQQRKIRNMIEQVQNSRTVIDQRDRMLNDLKEKVSFLEAENREMHHQMEFYLNNQVPKACNPDAKSKVVYSKPLTPTSPGNKSLPFIKVVEIKT